MNTDLFETTARGRLAPASDTKNEAGGAAYALSAKAALAQYSATGTLGDTFYASAEAQLDTIVKLCETLDPKFISQVAVYSRRRGLMKDLPLLLLAILACRKDVEGALLSTTFRAVVDNGGQLRHFVQMIRSGVLGRKSFGTLPKRLIQGWLANAGTRALLNASIGTKPTLADVIKMVHPKPIDDARAALYGYLIGRLPLTQYHLLPETIRLYEAWKVERNGTPPDVPFQLLTGLKDLSPTAWKAIAERATWTQLRMNLNTFARHHVFEDEALLATLAARLRDEALVSKTKAFPYQIFSAYLAADGIPAALKDALHDAMEAATKNVPALNGKVYVLVDVSGSMTQHPVTGSKNGATTSATCHQVAALMAACVLRRNPTAEVLTFDNCVYKPTVEPRDTVMTIAKVLASHGGGGTNCSMPLMYLNSESREGDVVIFLSDNESWIDVARSRAYNPPTEVMAEWRKFQVRSPKARLVCVDLAPNSTTQAASAHGEILNVGGWSDEVFSIVARFVSGVAKDWITVIEEDHLYGVGRGEWDVEVHLAK